MTNRSTDERVEKIVNAVPNNWLDPLLTGPTAIKVPAGCPDIERLLNAVRERVRKETKALLQRQHLALRPIGGTRR